MGQYSFVFASPEAALRPYWRKVFLGKIWQKQMKLLVVDEAHCISEWGEDFRKEYSELHILRSIFSVPALALTATTTNAVFKDIRRNLHLMDDTKITYVVPDRPNIFLDIIRTPLQDSIPWLVQYIQKEGVKSKKIIVYCRSLERVSDLWLSMMDELGEDAYAEKKKGVENRLIEMFHSSSEEKTKNRILKSFSSSKSNIRCVISTIALGMGIQIADISLVLHYGSPKSSLTYWQEVGRTARDGRPGYAFAMVDGRSLSNKTTKADIKEIVKNENNQCIRKLVLLNFKLDTVASEVFDNFGSSTEICVGGHSDGSYCICKLCSCCCICREKCPCQEKKKASVQTYLDA